MNRFALVLLLGTALLAWTQDNDGAAPVQAVVGDTTQAAMNNPMQRGNGPSYSDLYCSGFVSRQAISHANPVIGDKNIPDEILSSGDNTLFLESAGLQVGTQYSVVRELRDPNNYPPFRGQQALLAGSGQPYAELGRVRVVDMHGDVAVAKLEFSCEPIAPGDYAVPYQERAALRFRPAVKVDEFSHASKLDGQVVMAKDFVTMVGAGEKVYLNVGGDQGLKPGDYVRAVRSYSSDKIGEAEKYSYMVPQSEDTQATARRKRLDYGRLPRRVLGEMIVLNVTQSSATAMVTYSRESIRVGDGVEVEKNR